MVGCVSRTSLSLHTDDDADDDVVGVECGEDDVLEDDDAPQPNSQH